MRWPGGITWHLCAAALSAFMLTAVVAQEDDYFFNYGKTNFCYWL